MFENLFDFTFTQADIDDSMSLKFPPPIVPKFKEGEKVRIKGQYWDTVTVTKVVPKENQYEGETNYCVYAEVKGNGFALSHEYIEETDSHEMLIRNTSKHWKAVVVPESVLT